MSDIPNTDPAPVTPPPTRFSLSFRPFNASDFEFSISPPLSDDQTGTIGSALSSYVTMYEQHIAVLSNAAATVAAERDTAVGRVSTLEADLAAAEARIKVLNDQLASAGPTGPSSLEVPNPTAEDPESIAIALQAGRPLTSGQAAAVIHSLQAGAAAIRMTWKLEYYLRAYDLGRDTVRASMAEAVADVSGSAIPVTFDYEAADRARAQLRIDLKNAETTTGIVAAAIKCGMTFLVA